MLRYHNITGNLDVLKESTALRRLYLQKTRVSGNLQSLAKAKGLENLFLQGTEIDGDLVALSNAKDLQNLLLSKTKVYGDVVALKNAQDLRSLQLAETRIHGNLGSLANLTKLWNLQLSNTKVSGDLAVILQWKKIGHLDLSGTKVTSHPTEKWQNCCERLQTLDLGRSKINIVNGFLANFHSLNEFICPFPALRALDMTGSPLNIIVKELLRPFAGCQKLRIFKAAECNLTGPMPDRLHEFQTIITWPLGKVLQLLDLSSNHVTKVEALPPNCRAVSFRGNPQISFNQDVVKKATDHFVSLDLRNASFAHPSDTRSGKNLSNVFKVGASGPIIFWTTTVFQQCLHNEIISHV